MRQALHILYIIVGVALMGGCMGEGAGNGHVPHPKDTLYTQNYYLSHFKDFCL